MVPTLFFYQLVLVALVWLCVMLHWAWPSDPATCPPPSEPTPPKPKRHREPTPFAGLTTKPHCATCEHGTAPRPPAPSTPPPRIVPNTVRLNFCMAAELSDATGRYGRSTPFHWPTH
jgi:hypothetical protein